MVPSCFLSQLKIPTDSKPYLNSRKSPFGDVKFLGILCLELSHERMFVLISEYFLGLDRAYMGVRIE